MIIKPHAKIKKLFGILGALFFAICAYPQVYTVWISKDTSSLSSSFLILWALGELFMWLYVFIDNYETNKWQYPLHVNYLLNSISLIYLLLMKFG